MQRQNFVSLLIIFTQAHDDPRSAGGCSTRGEALIIEVVKEKTFWGRRNSNTGKGGSKTGSSDTGATRKHVQFKGTGQDAYTTRSPVFGTLTKSPVKNNPNKALDCCPV